MHFRLIGNVISGAVVKKEGFFSEQMKRPMNLRVKHSLKLKPLSLKQCRIQMIHNYLKKVIRNI